MQIIIVIIKIIKEFFQISIFQYAIKNKMTNFGTQFVHPFQIHPRNPYNKLIYHQHRVHI